MKDWHPMAWIAYISLGINSVLNILAAAKEKPPLANWLSPFIKTYILGYGPAIFFMIATIFFILELRRSKEKPTTTIHPPIPVLPPKQSSLVKSNKFYSERNKSDLANAFTDLAEILNNYGPNIRQKAQYVVDIWNLGSGRISSQDITNLITELNNVGSLANNLYQDLHNDKGFLKKYVAYKDELQPILHNYNLLLIFIGNINRFRNVLMTIQRAEKYDDRDLINLMIADSRLAFDGYLSGIRIFNEWVNETPKRIAAFRNSQL